MGHFLTQRGIGGDFLFDEACSAEELLCARRTQHARSTIGEGAALREGAAVREGVRSHFRVCCRRGGGPQRTMEVSQLKQFETYCATLYTSPDSGERSAAEAALVQLSASPEYIPQCQFVLDHSKCGARPDD